MLKCNLKVLLAERNLKITQVSNDTGISRTTLTSLAFNYAKGIQFDTLNTLCNYLKITPRELFIYLPYDIDVQLEDFRYDDRLLNSYVKFSVTLLKEEKKYKASLSANMEYYDKKFKFIAQEPQIQDENDKREFDMVKEYLEKLPIQFFINMENEFKDKILLELKSNQFFEELNRERDIKEYIEAGDISIVFDWTFLNK